MARSTHHVTCLLSATALFFFGIGCQPQPSTTPQGQTAHEDGHVEGEHEHPTTYAGALKEIQHLYGEIREPLTKGDVAAAHGPLHEVAHLMEDLPGLIDQETWPAEEKNRVTKLSDSLFDAFGKIDGSLPEHGGASIDATKLVEEIDGLMKQLPNGTGP